MVYSLANVQDRVAEKIRVVRLSELSPEYIRGQLGI